MTIRRGLLFGAGLALASPAVAAPPAALGAPYPGAAMVGAPEYRGCGVRYHFRADAPARAIADFYLSQGRTAGLTLEKDNAGQFADSRMIFFDETGPGRLLFVLIDPQAKPVTGVVYVVRARPAGCDQGR